MLPQWHALTDALNGPRDRHQPRNAAQLRSKARIVSSLQGVGVNRQRRSRSSSMDGAV